MHILFGWTEQQICVSAAIDHCFLSRQTILACFVIALWMHFGPIPLLVLLAANYCYLCVAGEFSLL